MKTAFAIAAHPDDIEFLMSGTLMLLHEVGYEIHYMNIANGSCGTTEYEVHAITRIRRGEAQAAAESIGAIFHRSLCNDLEVFYDKKLLKRLASVVRSVAPEIVLTHSPSDYMEDHVNAGRLAVTAVFARSMPNFPVHPDRLPTDQKTTLYHAQPYGNRDPLRQIVEPDLFVDTTGVIDRKVEMLSHHKSQKQWLDVSQGLDSYLHTLRDLDGEVGHMSGVFQYAEGWRRHLHLGFCDKEDDPLRVALKGKVLAK